MKPYAIVFATALCFTLTACKPDAALKKSEVFGKGSVPGTPPPRASDSSPAADAPAGPVGNVSGTILFAGKAPAPVLIDTSMDPACTLSNAKVYSEQYSVTDGKLANVFVYVKQGPPAAMNITPILPPTILDQKNCQYVPHVIGVFQGGLVEFHNDDPTMHNIHTMPTVVGNETVDISQGPRGAPVTKKFTNAELMMPVRCNNHPWMNAYINVSPSPWFAVTDKNGHFDLKGLPAGQYTLAAVHEKLGEKTIQVTVPASATTKVDLSYSLTN
jgi:hypothetical protein